MALYTDEKYHISMVAEWFHIIPHVDITFQPVNSTFDPTSNIYLESLGILIAVPGFWLILTLLAFLIFFLCRCCDSSFKKKKKLTPLKWTLAIFALLCCGALSLGLFGNDQAHSGMLNVQKATEQMETIITSVRNETLNIQNILEQKVNPGLDKLEKAFENSQISDDQRKLLLELLRKMEGNVTDGTGSVKDINTKMDQIDMRSIPSVISLIELFRWPATIALLCVLILVCLVLLWGVIRHSRCLLILFSVLGLLSVVICWVLVSLYLGVCVAGSDFCLNPEPFIYKQASGTVETTVVTYYLKCDDKADNPFSKGIEDGKKAVDNVEMMRKNVTNVVVKLPLKKEVRDILEQLQNQLNRTERILNGLSALLDCHALHKEYISAMDATCTNVLEGTAFMLVSAAGAGLLFTVLIWVASHTWIHIRQKRPMEHVDEEDPFLPPSAVGASSRRNRDTYGSTGVRPRFSHTPPQTPHFTASLNGRSASREEQAFLQGRYTPPPAYDRLSGEGQLGLYGPRTTITT